MTKNIILDTNVWLNTLLQINPYDKLLKFLLNENKQYQVLIDSYGAAEAVHSLRGLAKEIHASTTAYERAFWSILNKLNCLFDFDVPITNNLLEMAKNKTEYLMLAKTYELETKDVPFVVLAFKHKAVLITSDKRSLLDKRKLVQEKLAIVILSLDEFFESVRR